MTLARIKAIGFDLGETLICYGVPLNWKAHYGRALAGVAGACGCDASREAIEAAGRILVRYNTREAPRTKEVSAEHIFGEILSAWDVDGSAVATAVDAFFGYFQQNAAAYPESRAVLDGLRVSGVRVGLLTDVPYGMPRRHVEQDLRRAGLADAFDAVLTSADVGMRKPAREGFERLAEALCCSPGEMVYVGNEAKDVEGAKAAGALAVLIDRDSAGACFGEDVRIESLNELTGLLGAPGHEDAGR